MRDHSGVYYLKENRYGIQQCRHGFWHLREDRPCQHCEKTRIDDVEFWKGMDHQAVQAESRVMVMLGTERPILPMGLVTK